MTSMYYVRRTVSVNQAPVRMTRFWASSRVETLPRNLIARLSRAGSRGGQLERRHLLCARSAGDGNTEERCGGLFWIWILREERPAFYSQWTRRENAPGRTPFGKPGLVSFCVNRVNSADHFSSGAKPFPPGSGSITATATATASARRASERARVARQSSLSGFTIGVQNVHRISRLRFSQLSIWY